MQCILTPTGFQLSFTQNKAVVNIHILSTVDKGYTYMYLQLLHDLQAFDFDQVKSCLNAVFCDECVTKHGRLLSTTPAHCFVYLHAATLPCALSSNVPASASWLVPQQI